MATTSQPRIDTQRENNENQGSFVTLKKRLFRLFASPCFIPSVLKGIIIGSGFGIVKTVIFKSNSRQRIAQ
jgi:hypothetical protein